MAIVLVVSSSYSLSAFSQCFILVYLQHLLLVLIVLIYDSAGHMLDEEAENFELFETQMNYPEKAENCEPIVIPGKDNIGELDDFKTPPVVEVSIIQVSKDDSSDDFVEPHKTRSGKVLTPVKKKKIPTGVRKKDPAQIGRASCRERVLRLV